MTEIHAKMTVIEKTAPVTSINQFTGLSKKSLSVIFCPLQNCNHYCISDEKNRLVEAFESHIKSIHKMKPTKFCLGLMQSKIDEFKTFKVKHHTDPFLFVSLEDVVANVMRNSSHE